MSELRFKVQETGTKINERRSGRLLHYHAFSIIEEGILPDNCMKTLLQIFLCCLTVGILRAQGTRPSSHQAADVTRFDPARDAAKDIDAAVVEARASGRRILLDVGGEWCIWCRRLDSLFQRRADLADFMHSHFVVVKVNVSPENRNEAVLARYPKVAGYPHLFVLGGDGALLHSQDTGALEAGKGHDPEKVLAFLKSWAPPQSNTQRSDSASTGR